MFKIVIELEDNGRGEFRYEVEGRAMHGTTDLEGFAAQKIQEALKGVAKEIKARMHGKSGVNILDEEESDYRNFFGLN